jgi:predicted RNase H-like HicB family nuclease
VSYQPVPPTEGAGFYAHIPALGITTEGETLEEAKAMAQDAIEGFVEAAAEIGEELPVDDITVERLETSA